MSDMVGTGGAIGPERAKLWLEGLRLFRENWREWAKWAVWFFVITAVLQAIFYDPAAQETVSAITAAHAGTGKGFTSEEKATLWHVLLHNLTNAIPVMIVGVVQAYVFTVFFMRKQSGINIRAPGVPAFFCWAWKYLQLALVAVAVFAVTVGVPVLLGLVLIKRNPDIAPAAFIFGLIGFCFSCFLMFRLSLVIPLAVCDIKPVFRTSWALMKGNCWRLFGNFLLLILAALGLLIIAIVVELAAGMILGVAVEAVYTHMASGATSPVPARQLIDHPLHVILDSFNACVVNGIIWAFYSSTTHILYRERHMVASQSGSVA